MNDLLPMINCHWVAKFQIAPGGNDTLFYVVTRNSKSTINASSSTGDFANYNDNNCTGQKLSPIYMYINTYIVFTHCTKYSAE